MKDNEKIKKLIKLSEENPDLEIYPMINEEVCQSDDFAYWLGSISRIEKEHVWHTNERIYLSEDQIKEEIHYNLCNESENKPQIPEAEFNLLVDREYNTKVKLGEIKEVIVIYIELP